MNKLDWIIIGGSLNALLLAIMLRFQRVLKEKKTHYLPDIDLRKIEKAYQATLYQILADDIKSYRTVQLNILYYFLLLFGATIGLSYVEPFSSKVIILVILIHTIFDAGFYLIFEYQYRLQETRKGIIKHKELHEPALELKVGYDPEKLRKHRDDYKL